jgi:hypothetical protein
MENPPILDDRYRKNADGKIAKHCFCEKQLVDILSLME